MQLDDLDRKLLDVLAADACIPVANLARRVGAARSTVQQRLQRLESQGVISGYTVRLGPGVDGGVAAYVQVVVDPKRTESAVREIGSLSSVRELHAVSGPFDFIAVVRADSPEALDETLDRIGRITGVERTTSSIVLATKKPAGPA